MRLWSGISVLETAGIRSSQEAVVAKGIPNRNYELFKRARGQRCRSGDRHLRDVDSLGRINSRLSTWFDYAEFDSLRSRLSGYFRKGVNALVRVRQSLRMIARADT